MRLAPTTKAAPAPPPQRVAALRGPGQRSAPTKAKSAGGLMGKTGLAKAMSRLFAPKKPPMESLANMLSLGLIGKKHRHDEWNPYWIEVRAGLLVFYEGERDHGRAKAAPFVILPLVGCKVHCHAVERCREENMLMFERARQFRLANALDGDAPKALYNPNCPCRWAFEAEQQAKSGMRGKLSEANDPLVLQIQPAVQLVSGDFVVRTTARGVARRLRAAVSAGQGRIRQGGTGARPGGFGRAGEHQVHGQAGGVQQPGQAAAYGGRAHDLAGSHRQAVLCAAAVRVRDR
eukprot:ctg_2848.g460